jgi:uncharacterized protein (TIGR02145 family)
MKKLCFLLLFTLVICSHFTGCQQTGTVTDVDGNVYRTVIVGGQEWMADNLKTTRYDNGDPITNVRDDDEWSSVATGAWCYYNNDESNDGLYGKLYNWDAVTDPRNLCPADWHVPSDVEWTELTDSLGGEFEAGGKMKTRGTIEAGTGLWQQPNTAASNLSGFSGLPGGYRFGSGGFGFMGEIGFWWTPTMDTVKPERGAWGRYLNYNSGTVFRGHGPLLSGFSVRCIKDQQ